MSKAIEPCKNNFKEWQFYKLQITTQDTSIDKETIIDEITWKQWINNALKRSHGLFGEGIEYFIVNQEDKIAFLKVSYQDREAFSSAIGTYISTDDLIGTPLAVTTLQETSDVNNLEIGEDDKLWYKKFVEEIVDDAKCQ
ncbi:hypothetical protein NCAS_0B05580 [Naumovozyma castellii]|uniref:Ribonucleases P/MRP subunit Pop8-like domain-containing protein n=1 Tax=Naumovozyma castellii TaxID=27288 RepID=G0V9M6_NAUCA|nr:hypothetical protein NCAS_0B05580 [Naumovozyma castellii CBS 4309]CCC68642.1 hypothetical protein NCAS_0B05580 [Naumovozyma castellii CBS 4309]